jgi:asparagine synthase (glutamine-hydrolysing)
MCGIAGYLVMDPRQAERPALQPMIACMAHRGPDDMGIYEKGPIGLAHCRLSILDLTQSGHQPMTNEDRTVWVTYNGEIYNYLDLKKDLTAKGHVFVGTSDTEVLVHGYEEWGETLPERIRGMFAFAVWDNRHQALFLARDHFGIKPLYYALAGQVFLFSSEIKAILQYPKISRTVDPVALDQFFSFLYIPEPRTAFKEIRALPFAHTMKVKDGALTQKRYWTFSTGNYSQFDEAEAKKSVADILQNSVRSMLQADVPVGLFLSGGLDSTSILAFASREYDKPLHAFTIGFGSAARHWDELSAARSFAERYGAIHHAFRLDPNVVDILPKVVKHFDQPFANPTAIILYLLSEKTREHVKVVLAGTGGDEMFAGYPRYQGMLYYDRIYSRLPAFLRQSLAWMAEKYGRDALDGRLWHQRVRRFLEGGALSFEDCYIRLLVAMTDRQRLQLYTREFQSNIENHDAAEFLKPFLQSGGKTDKTDCLMETDLQSYLPYNQLMYGDRMSMAHGLEIRVPFVDQRVVEVASGFSLKQKLLRGETKGLFREAMRGILPEEIIRAPKLGLNLPIALWFRTELRAWLQDVLNPDRIKRRGLFNPAGVQTLLGEHMGGKRDHSLLIWAMVVYEVWCQIYLDGNDLQSISNN